MEFNHEKKYLEKKVIPFDANSIKNVSDVLNSLKYCGFQGKNLGRALDVLYEMVSDNLCLTVLTLSGAMVPAGMGELICALIENELIDVLVSTGANISHDLVNVATKGGHYLGSPNVDDNELYELKINRIYDVFLPEECYDEAEYFLLKLLNDTFKSKRIRLAHSDFLQIIGSKIKQRCILSTAAKHKIPIFVPAISDSELSIDLIKFTETEGYDIEFEVYADIKKFAKIIQSTQESGTLIIGGGVPRNWTQQIFPYLDNLEKLRDRGYESGYKYSVRIHTATEYDGGLSGCTISESKSWGKYSINSKHISVWCDATIALPILITGLFQKLKII